MIPSLLWVDSFCQTICVYQSAACEIAAYAYLQPERLSLMLRRNPGHKVDQGRRRRAVIKMNGLKRHLLSLRDLSLCQVLMLLLLQ